MSAVSAPSPSPSSATMPTASMQPSPATSASETVADAAERAHAPHAMDRLVADVKIAELTRALRAGLAYASFKAHHGVVRLTIDDLERDLADKAAANASSTASLKRRAPPTSMGPPVSPSPSLYNSVLASPPPAKRARHAHPNALLPPRASPRSSLRSQAARSPRNAAQRPSHRADAIAGSSSQPSEPDAISAAATLTSLLLTSRSPRSAPVSRTSSIASSSQHTLLAGSSQGSRLDDPLPVSPFQRTNTPPPNRKTDDVKEAAELMLYLATSPSPAQVHSKAASNKDRVAGTARVLFPGAPSASNSASNAPGSPLRHSSTAAAPQSPPSTSRSFSPARTPSQSTSHLLTPKSAGFNINDYINVSPSPSAPPPSYFASGSSGYRPNMAARRLFEEETSAASSQRRNMFGEEPTGLAAGIDLVNAA